MGGWGDPSFPLLSLVAPWGFLMVVESFTAMLELGGGQLNEGHPLSQGGSCILHCPVRKGNYLAIQIKSLDQPVKGKSDNFFFPMAGISPLLDLSLFYYLHSGREISLGWGSQFSPSLGLLLKPRFPQEASLFPLPPVSAVQVGPLCCRHPSPYP